MFTKKTLLILSLLLGFVGSSFAQLGSVHGTVLDATNNNEPMFRVLVKVEGTSIGGVTDFDGKFKLSASPGTYTLVFTFMGYKTKKIAGVKINAGETASFKTTMEENIKIVGGDGEGGGVTIEGRIDRTSEEALIVERKKSNNLVQIIGAETLEKAAAGNVAEGIKKLVGISVVGSKYVYVRGLGDRYNSTYLNSFPIASPDPDKRTLPMDIFPTSIVKNITVVKNFSPELYGDFSGGAMLIETKDFPEYKTLKIGMGVSANTQSTFKDFSTTKESANDKFGYNSDRVRYDFKESKKYETSWDPIVKSAPINKNFSIVFGNQYNINKDKGSRLGVLLSTNFSDGYEYRVGNYRTYSSTGSKQVDFAFDTYNYTTNKSGLMSLTYDFNANNSLRLNTLYTHLTSDQVRDTHGFYWDPPVDDNDIFNRRFTYRENSLFSPQLTGNHKLHEKLVYKWGLSYSKALSEEPDRRQLVYYYPKAKEAPSTMTLNAIDVADNHRFFYELGDVDMTAKTSIQYIIKANEENKDSPLTSLSVGVDYRNKKRNFDAFKTLYVVDDLIIKNGAMDVNNIDKYINTQNYDGDYYVEEGTQVSDNYNADLNIIGLYTDFSHVFSNKFFGKVGFRVETSKQGVDYKKQSDSPSTPYRRAELQEVTFLPSITGKYSLSEDKLLKFSASRTIARPDFKEVSEFQYKAFFGGFSTQGNPDLINGVNYNADIRFEKYLTNGVGFFAVGVYGKQLNDAITPVILGGSVALQTFINAKQAQVAGAEIEFQRKLDFFDVPFLNKMTFSTNVSVNVSKVELGNQKKYPVSTTSQTRPMIGASPYLINADLSYTHDGDKLKSSWTLAYNIFGRRLVNVGSEGLGDAYQIPAGTLNLSIRNDIGMKRRWGVNLVAKNLLNPNFASEQEIVDKQGKVIETLPFDSYNKGISFSIGVSYNVFVD